MNIAFNIDEQITHLKNYGVEFDNEEKAKEIQNLRIELNNEKIGKSLAKYNFDEKQSATFLEAFNSEDPVIRANNLLSLIDIKSKEEIEKVKKEFNASTKLPNGGDPKEVKTSYGSTLFDSTHKI